MVKRFLEMKERGEKISVLTAYDMPSASIMDEAGIDAILVGDSLGMVMLGYTNTQAVTMHDMLEHVRPVARGAKNAHVIGDMPYKSFDTPSEAVKNARLLVEAGAQSVKVEGDLPDVVEALIAEDIQVMGHVGLTPQTITKFRVQGRDEESAKKIVDGALSLEKSGCYSIVLECIPVALAKTITESLKIPTIGIGAGPHCDGQVMVSHDMLGIFNDFEPKFVKKYANIREEMKKAFQEYNNEVKKGSYPDLEHSYE
ncbi:3-methyl-2-oxobutanoate hydroxymethyltransferase [archaeon]